MNKVVNDSINHTIDSNKFTNLKESIKAKKTMINEFIGVYSMVNTIIYNFIHFNLILIKL